MVNIDISLPEGFLLPENRDGFWVSQTRKELWAIQLDIVAKIKEICDKNNLRWFLDGGTLLGAVRHKGYIPWDDDIDIMIPRKDYDVFVKKAIEYFKEPYFVQTDYTDLGFFNMTKIRRSDTAAIRMGIDKEKTIGNFSAPYYNCGIFVDVFPMDKAPEDINDFQMFMNELSQVKMLGQNVKEHIKRNNPYFKDYSIELLRSISRSYDKMRTLFKDTDSRYYAQTSLPYTSNTLKHVSDYERTVLRPFEFMELPCPEGYRNALIDIYGEDYMTPIQGTSKHGTLFIDTNNSYTNYYGKHQLLLKDDPMNASPSDSGYDISYYMESPHGKAENKPETYYY